MREVSLVRLEQLVLGVAHESRPALAKSNPTVLFVDWGHRSLVVTARLVAWFVAPNVVIGHAAVCFGSVARYLGRLALTMGERDRALEHLRHAVDSSAALRAPGQLAHARLDYALALGAGRDGSRARTLIEQAAAAAAELELPLVARRAESLASPHGG
jgi:hypothetical protein